MSESHKPNEGEFTLEEILAEFSDGSVGTAQNLPYTPEQEAEDLREKREEAFFFRPKSNSEEPPAKKESEEKPPKEKSKEKPVKESSEEKPAEKTESRKLAPARSAKIIDLPQMAESVAQKSPPPPPKKESVPPAPPKKETPPAEKIIEPEFPNAQPENPVAAGIDQLLKKADNFADHMFE